MDLGHPNIVRLHEVFSAHSEGQPHTYVVQAYHPSALTLDEAYIQQRLPLNEETIWSHALQLIAAVHTVHLAGMAVRVIDMSHVLLTSKEVRGGCPAALAPPPRALASLGISWHLSAFPAHAWCGVHLTAHPVCPPRPRSPRLRRYGSPARGSSM